MTQKSIEQGGFPEPDATHYLLSCLNDIHDLGQEDFAAEFKRASDKLKRGGDLAKMQFICLSLHENADYEQFKEGAKVLEQYITDHPGTPGDVHGFQILVNQLDVAMMTKWSAWKSLLNDKKELTAEVKSLQEKHEQDQALIEELNKQIEQLKNIEKIIKSRETGQ